MYMNIKFREKTEIWTLLYWSIRIRTDIETQVQNNVQQLQNGKLDDFKRMLEPSLC